MAGDVKVAVVSALHDASGGATTDYTKSGFGTPKACIVIQSNDATDNTSVEGESKLSIGFSDFTDDFCIAHHDEDASAKVDCDAIKSAIRCYIRLNSVGAVELGGVASTITDGVRLTNNIGGSGEDKFVTVILFGGADLKVSVQSSAPSVAL